MGFISVQTHQFPKHDWTERKCGGNHEPIFYRFTSSPLYWLLSCL